MTHTSMMVWGKAVLRFYSGSYEEENAPSNGKAVTCLLNNLEELSLLFLGKELALRLIQVTKSIGFLYIFGNTSGSGFGYSCT